MNKDTAKKVKEIVNKFNNLNGSSFVGIKEYTSKTTGETANHVVNAKFSYEKAVKKDLKALQNITDEEIMEISTKFGFTTELIKTAVAKMIESFINNQNSETQNNQSKGQENAYIQITNSIKLHIETGKLHIYALAISKQVIVEGTYKVVNSKELTLCQNSIKKYFNFSTAKYRQFIIDENMLTSVKISGEQYQLK